MTDIRHHYYDLCQPISPDDPRQFFFVANSYLPLDYFKRHRFTVDHFVLAVCLAAVLALVAWTQVF